MLHRIRSWRFFSRPNQIKYSTSLESTQPGSEVIERLKESIRPLYDHQARKLKYIQEGKDVGIMEITPQHLLNGMRGVPSLVWDVSSVDAHEGIRYRGVTIDDLLRRLPIAPSTQIPSVESLFWLLMTGSLPKTDDVNVLKKALVSSVRFDAMCNTVCRTLDSLPIELHPMSQFIIGIVTAQGNSTFSKAYKSGIATKSNTWEFALVDAVQLLSHLPVIAAYVHRRTYRPEILHTFQEDVTETSAKDLDWAARFGLLLGNDNPVFHDLLRLFVILHADHEGGNASAHTANIISSALSDPFLSFAGAMCSLAGPLHGLANQEALKWLLHLKSSLDAKNFDFSDQNLLREAVQIHAKAELSSRKIIPGYGHAILRTVDPRFLALKRWALQNAPDDPLIKLNLICAEEIPKVLSEQPRISNPFPNVDCGSGTALFHCGIQDPEFLCVLFGLSRSVGILASLVWARIFKSPMERPKSLTIDALTELIKKRVRRKSSPGVALT